MGSFSGLRVGSVFASDYRVIRPLAEGGMGAVYVVEQVSTGKQRALKVMHPTLVPDERSRARFAEEARLGARIESEHVVEVLGAGVDAESGMPWLCMELLEGSSFEKLVEERGALPPGEVLELLDEVCHALAEAHRQGIIHRDLKPENLFLARSRRRGARASQVKILDFGIARTVEQSRTAATVTAAIGSPLWMAPEQAQAGAKLRPSTDVWALGLIAFTLLTRRTFWLTSNAPEFNLSALLVELMVQPIPAPSARAAELACGVTLPPGFDAWFLRCVERDPAMRFADAGQAFSALASVLAPSEPASPTPRTQVMPSTPTAPMRSTPSTMVLSDAQRASAATIAGPRPMALRMGLVGGAGAALVAVAVLAFWAAGAFDGGRVQLGQRPLSLSEPRTGEQVAPAEAPAAPPEPQPPAPARVVAHDEDFGFVEEGTIVVSTDIEGGSLWIDGQRHGDLVDGMTVALPPGAYRFEVRVGENLVATRLVGLSVGAREPVHLNWPVVPDEPARAAPAPRDPPPRRPTPSVPRGRTGLPSNPF